MEENDDFWPSNQPSIRPLSGGGLVRQPRAPQPKPPTDDLIGAQLVNSDSISALKEHQQQTCASSCIFFMILYIFIFYIYFYIYNFSSLFFSQITFIK